MTLTLHSEYRILGLFKDPIDVSEVSVQDKVNFEIRYMRMSHRKNDGTRSWSKNLDQSTTHISKQINNTPGYTRFKNNIFTIKFNLEYLPVIAWISGLVRPVILCHMSHVTQFQNLSIFTWHKKLMSHKTKELELVPSYEIMNEKYGN